MEKETFEQEVEGSLDDGGSSKTKSVLHIAAVATHQERYMPLLIQSCQKHQINLEVLGWNEKLLGFAFRLQKTLEYVQTLPPNDVVMFIDAFDVILLQGSEIILKKFYASKAQMVISKDGDHPNKLINFCIKKVFRPVGDTYINIGAFIGYAGYVTELMRALFRFGEGFSQKENDQELLARYLSENRSLIGTEILIDQNSDLFLNLYGGHPVWIGSNEYKLEHHHKDIDIQKDGTLHFLPTDSWPCVLHGPANSSLMEIFDKMGYKLPANPDKNYTSLSHMGYLMRMSKHYWQFLYGMVIKIVLAILIMVLVGFLFFHWRRLRNAPPTAQQHVVRIIPYQPPSDPAAAALSGGLAHAHHQVPSQ